MMIARLIQRAFVIAFATVLLVSARAVAQESLRVCADPNYLPYSDRAGNGFENKVAQAIAKYMGRQLTYTWETMRGDGGFDQFVNETLKAKRCDLIVDVPYAETDISTTRPYYIASYVFIFKKSRNYDLTSMDSPVLHHVRIGYEVDTPAEDGLKLRALTIGAKPFQVAETEGLSPGVFVDAVETNEINVGITWEPAVGYFLKAHPDLAVVTVPNSRTQGSPEQYTFPMAMATRDNDKALHDAVDRAIGQHKPQLETILHTYGVRFIGTEVSAQ